MINLFAISPSSGIVLRQLFFQYNSTFFARMQTQTRKRNKGNLKNSKAKLLHEAKLPAAMVTITTDRVNYIKDQTKAGMPSKDLSILTQKLYHYKKLALSIRFRKIALPRSLRYTSKNKQHFAHQSFNRTKLLRFYFKKFKKTVQNKKIIRLKGVHFYIPAYLQRDFRTLRAVKVQSPSYKDTFYPFQISLPKRYSFYRSRGY